MNKPGMIITGASGFLGGRLINSCCHNYTIYAIARGTRHMRFKPQADDIYWFDVDIGNYERLTAVFERIQCLGGAELILHLAGYYDFTGEEHPEYEHSNVLGTRNVLELAADLNLRRLYFTSSIAACPFPPPGEAITEETSPTAPPPYSRSKRAGEELLAQYSDRVPSAILRLAAIFSNWCEYEPLYNFLETWISNRWDSRILGGRGQWAIPYLHVRDLVPFFMAAIDLADELEPQEVLQGSPSGCTTMLELYHAATAAYFGRQRRYLYVPKPLARLGIEMRLLAGRLRGELPFERSWMGEYIDLKLNVDASHTHRRLNWRPTPELDILQCVPAMIRNRAQYPRQWRLRYELSKKGDNRYRERSVVGAPN